jgi:hypothetical protein
MGVADQKLIRVHGNSAKRQFKGVVTLHNGGNIVSRTFFVQDIKIN